MKKYIPTLLFSTITVIFMLLIIINPSVCTEGAANGLLLSGRVIIPSLFPFTVCVLFIVKSGILDIFCNSSKIIKRIFKLTPPLFIIMLLSFIGGYPIGAKLLNEAVKNGNVSAKNAGIMLNYCVNAGPAFIVLAVGESIGGSKKIGYILLASHLLASLVLSIFFAFFIKEEYSIKKTNKAKINITDCFVSAVTDAASAIISICSYVILFASIIAFTNYLSLKYKIFKFISPLLEVTNAVTKMRNLLVISFLLGFAGVCIWCQILSVGKNIKINLPIFVISRIIHGTISAILCFFILKIFKISISTASGIKLSYTYGGIALSLSMLSMVIVFIISIFNKKSTGNIIKDIV